MWVFFPWLGSCNSGGMRAVMLTDAAQRMKAWMEGGLKGRPDSWKWTWSLSHRWVWGPPDFSGRSFLTKSLSVTSDDNCCSRSTAVSTVDIHFSWTCHGLHAKNNHGWIWEGSETIILNGKYFWNDRVQRIVLLTSNYCVNQSKGLWSRGQWWKVDVPTTIFPYDCLHIITLNICILQCSHKYAYSMQKCLHLTISLMTGSVGLPLKATVEKDSNVYY